MLNKYPLWKNLIVFFAIVFGTIYALPNIYLPDFAIQVSSSTSGEVLGEYALEATRDSLDKANIDYFSPEINGGSVLVRFPDGASQQRGKRVVAQALNEAEGDYVVALNSAPTTPDWLDSIGAEPMKYGLDLRGGVHFLMEVDTESVIVDRIENLESDVKRKLREQKLRYKAVESPEQGVLHVAFATAEVRDEAREFLESEYNEFLFAGGEDPAPYVALTITQQTVEQIEDFAVTQNLQTIRNRVR